MKSIKSILFYGIFLWLFAQGTSCKAPFVPPDDWPPSGLDTTSHAFVWQIDTIGAQGVLYDVAIINDTLAYAVGEIYLRDSTGQIDPQAYSIATWNGVEWAPKKLYDSGNQLIPAIRGILAISATDVWLADGGVHRWNGVSQQASQSYGRIDLIGGVENGQSVDKLWGINSMDIYGVGRVGMITHFSGGWQKIESGTTVDMKDVFGESTGNRILTVASSVSDTRVLTLANGTVIGSINWPVGLRSLWISPSSTGYLSGVGGMWKETDTSWAIMEGLPDTVFSGVVRGNADNDLFVNVRAPAHFNGESWRFYSELPTDFSFQSVTTKGDLVVAVGFTITGGSFADKPAVVIGKRIH